MAARSVFRVSPEAEASRRELEASLATLPKRRTVDRGWLRQICLDAGADDVGFVEIDRAELGGTRDNAIRLFPTTRTLVSLVTLPQGGSPLLTVQYWRSFEHLEAFARNDTAPHLQAWRLYQQRASGTGRSGIFHETFLVKAGAYESIFDNMPPTGLGRFAPLHPAATSSRARSRIGAEPTEDHHAVN